VPWTSTGAGVAAGVGTLLLFWGADDLEAEGKEIAAGRYRTRPRQRKHKEK
jgi:hypothetical protein